MSDPAILGALAGFVLGLVDFFVLGWVMRIMARQRPEDRLGSQAILNVVRYAQLVLLTVAGWFVGPLIAMNPTG